MRTLLFASPVLAVLAIQTPLALAQAPMMERVQYCPAPAWMPQTYDQNSLDDRPRVRAIESNHFDADTEALRRGLTGSLGYDIAFLVRYVPNHHRGLGALVRYSLKVKQQQPEGVGLPVECFLVRALTFRPEDGVVWLIYGTYLARMGHKDAAIEKLLEAERLRPDDLNVVYNLGLVYFEKGDFPKAREYARRAYGAGFELQGLKDKLNRVGQWQ